MIGALLSAALVSAPCQVGASKAPAFCGTFTVPEDRARADGRNIALSYIVIKAKHPSRHAIVFNPGGPGASSTANAQDFADSDPSSAFGILRDRYDILLVDNRGTGKSAPQDCDFSPAAHPELYFSQLWPDQLVRSCHAQLAAKADLSLYSTTVAADDLDALREALGYQKLVLYGGSYGTRFYLAYARQHPLHVESVLLEGVAPPHFELIPLQMAGGAQTAITGLIKACVADKQCNAHFPKFGDHFAALIRRFDNGPIAMSVRNHATKQMQTVHLSKEVLTDRIRQTLYFPEKAAYLPVIVERAFDGNYAPLALQIDETTLFFKNVQANGLNLSVSCAEDIPFITEDAITLTSANTFEGDLRIRAQQRACRIWNVKPVSHSFVEPVRSNAPILMIEGMDDPASPLSSAQQALPYLPNARMLLVHGGSHDSSLPPCTDKLIVAFVRASSARSLDLKHCGLSYRRPAFSTLAPYEAASGENAAIRKRLRTLLDLLLAGRVDRTQLEPNTSKQFDDQTLKGMAMQAKSFGSVEAFIYKGTRPAAKGTTYVYLVHFDTFNLAMTVTIDAKGKIAFLDASPG